MIEASQVANASKGQLLMITYNLLLGRLDNIKEYANANNEKEFAYEIGRGRQIIQELIDTLDFKQEISKDLLRLYVYINGLLIKSMMNYEDKFIDEAIKLINILMEGWKQAIDSEDVRHKVMDNTQQVYAGLTYGKEDLNESILDDKNRGFKA